MIEKFQCTEGKMVIVNNKVSKWNVDLGAKNNGLAAFEFKKSGWGMGDQTYEIPVGTELEILGKPKRIPESGVQIQFKIEGESIIFAAWWIVFKHKVDSSI